MQEIVVLIEARLLDANAVKQYQAWMHRVEHFDQATHEAEVETLEAEWPNYSARQHDMLATLPKALVDDTASSLWCQEAGFVEPGRRERHAVVKIIASLSTK